MKQRRDDNNVFADVLQAQVEHLDANSSGYLRKILTGDFLPGQTIPDQKVSTAGVTAEVGTETGCQMVVATSVHLNANLKQ